MVPRTFFDRFGTHGVCVLPADALSDDPLIDPDTGEELPSLREQISLVNGIYHRIFCYARVLRSCGDGLYWADVAAIPDLFQSQADTTRVVLAEEDLHFALPYDIRLQGKSPAQIFKMMASHAREVRPLQRVEPTPMSAPAETVQQVEEATVLVPLPHIFISCETVQQVKAEGNVPQADAPKHRLWSWARLLWLRAALAVLRHQLVEASQHLHLHLSKLDSLVRKAFVAQHRTHAPLVHASPVSIGKRLVGWHLIIGVPMPTQVVA